MSTTTIKAIWPGEKAESVGELRNAWGSAPCAWDAMCSRYLDPGKNWMFQADALWPLWRRADIPASHRAVLAMTYDRMYIAKEHYQRAAADIRAWLLDFPVDDRKVNHWPAIAELLESSPDYPAIGFHMTSVSEDLWQGEWDEETEECGPPDWSRAWSLYEQFDKVDD